MTHQVLIDLQKDYNSSEMLLALMDLRDYYDESFTDDDRGIHKKESKDIKNLYIFQLDNEKYKKFKKKYIDDYEKLKSKIKEINKRISKKNNLKDYEEKYKIINYSIHNQRRRVTHFYKHLEAMYSKDIINIDTVTKYWPTDHVMDIIPLVLIPIENALWDHLNKDIFYSREYEEWLRKRKEEELFHLKNLYNDVYYYEKCLYDSDPWNIKIILKHINKSIKILISLLIHKIQKSSN